MKREFKKQVREYVVALLSFASIVCLAAEPTDDDRWMQLFVYSKLTAIAFGGIAYILCRWWGSRGLLPGDSEREK